MIQSYEFGDLVWQKDHEILPFDCFMVFKVDGERFMLRRAPNNNHAITYTRDCYQKDYISYGNPVYEI